MTQLTALQADVQLRTLLAIDARRAISNPVELRRGEVRSITLTIPLLTDRNSYLVVRLPDQAVQDLLSHVRTLPTNERNTFIRDWVMRNQQLIIEQHIRIGGRERRFRYDVVPVQSMPRVGEATPRRVEPAPQPPVSATVPRREPPATAPPQTAAPQGRVIQPGGAPPSSTTRRAPPLVPPPVVAPPQPTERPVAPAAPAARREEERWWLGGSGTRASPYRIRLPTRRARGDGIEASEIEIPITITNVGRFTINVTLSQISSSRFEATYREMIQLCRQGYGQTEEGRGGRVQLTGIPPLADMRARLYGGLPADMRRYAESH